MAGHVLDLKGIFGFFIPDGFDSVIHLVDLIDLACIVYYIEILGFLTVDLQRCYMLLLEFYD